MKPMTLILIGGLVAVLGTALAAIGTYLHNKKSSEKSTRLEIHAEDAKKEIQTVRHQSEKLQQQNDDLRIRLEKQAEATDALRRENTELYSKLSDASQEIHNTLTGGDSYCVVEFSFLDNSTGWLIMHNAGKYPLKRVVAQVVDLNFSFGDPQWVSWIQFGDLDGGMGNTSDPLKLDVALGVNYNIFVSTSRGSSSITFVRGKFIGNRWVIAIKIIAGGKVINEHIPDEYPIKDPNELFK